MPVNLIKDRVGSWSPMPSWGALGNWLLLHEGEFFQTSSARVRHAHQARPWSNMYRICLDNKVVCGMGKPSEWGLGWECPEEAYRLVVEQGTRCWVRTRTGGLKKNSWRGGSGRLIRLDPEMDAPSTVHKTYALLPFPWKRSPSQSFTRYLTSAYLSRKTQI